MALFRNITHSVHLHNFTGFPLDTHSCFGGVNIFPVIVAELCVLEWDNLLRVALLAILGPQQREGYTRFGHFMKHGCTIGHSPLGLSPAWVKFPDVGVG